MLLTCISRGTRTCGWADLVSPAGKARRGTRQVCQMPEQVKCPQPAGSASSAFSPLHHPARVHHSTGTSSPSTRTRLKVQRWESVEETADEWWRVAESGVSSVCECVCVCLTCFRSILCLSPCVFVVACVCVSLLSLTVYQGICFALYSPSC